MALRSKHNLPSFKVIVLLYSISYKPYICKAFTPASVLNHSLASPSSVSRVMYQKYVNSVPLYRQENGWEQIGIGLSRATMANWIIRISEDHLMPVVNHLRKELLKRDIIHCDETPVQRFLRKMVKRHRPSHICGCTVVAVMVKNL